MLKVIENFINEQEEKDILSTIRPTTVKRGNERNTVVRYGSPLPYKASLKSEVIPSHYLPICERIHLLGYDLPDSVSINEYLRTQAIDWHIDSLSSGPVIIVLSLLSSAKMGLRNTKTNENQTIILPQRSLLILSEEHRYEWEHCVHPVEDHRFSIVFRKGTHVNI